MKLRKIELYRPEFEVEFHGKSLLIGKIKAAFICMICTRIIPITLSGKTISRWIVIPKLIVSGGS